MNDFFDSALPHYSLWIVIAGCLLTGIGAFVQYRKEVIAVNKEMIAAKEALETEKRRVAEHDSLQKRSNILLDSTTKILGDTRHLLDDSKSLLENAHLLLDKSDTTINSQSKIIGKQVETINYLVGTDVAPELIMRLEPFLDSYTEYKIAIFIKIHDKYPLNGVYVSTAYTTDVEINKIVEESETRNELKVRVSKEEQELPEEGPLNIPGERQFLIKRLTHQFPLKKEKTFYHIFLRWPKGSYQLEGELSFNNYMPSFRLTSLLVNGLPPEPRSVGPYFRFSNGIGPNAQKSIELNRAIESHEKILLENFKKGQPPK